MTRVCLRQIDCVFRSQNLNPKSSNVMLPNEICDRFCVGLGASTIRVHFVFKASLDRKNKISTAHPVSIHPSVCLRLWSPSRCPSLLDSFCPQTSPHPLSFLLPVVLSQASCVCITWGSTCHKCCILFTTTTAYGHTHIPILCEDFDCYPSPQPNLNHPN